jgi:putative sterol carrier protein
VGIDPTAVDPEEFARQVGLVSDDDLATLMSSELRSTALDEIFNRMVAHFRPERARGLDAVVHWKIFDRPGGGYDHFELVIADGACTLSDHPGKAPNVTFRIPPVDFLKLVTGNASPTGLALRRRLQVLGDLGLARRLGTLFEVPSRR